MMIRDKNLEPELVPLFIICYNNGGKGYIAIILPSNNTSYSLMVASKSAAALRMAE